LRKQKTAAASSKKQKASSRVRGSNGGAGRTGQQHKQKEVANQLV